MFRRSAVLTVAACLALSACTSGGTRTGPPPRHDTPVPAPSGLAKAVEDFLTTAYRFEMTAAEGAYRGAVDPAADAFDTTITITSDGATLTIETRGLGDAYFARFTGLPQPEYATGAWYSVDPQRFADKGALGIGSAGDPTGVRALATAAVTATPAGDRALAGTVDLREVPNWGPVGRARITQLGARAGAVPFAAGLDDRGRLASIEVRVPGDTVTAAYHDFGAAIRVDRPAGAQPLPPGLYGILGL